MDFYRRWLQDALSTLPLDQGTAGANAKSIGFDISDAHFPLEHQANVEFITHDILQPFPQQLHEQFDLVHVRLLVLALKQNEIATAVKNVASLLSKCYYHQHHHHAMSE